MKDFHTITRGDVCVLCAYMYEYATQCEHMHIVHNKFTLMHFCIMYLHFQGLGFWEEGVGGEGGQYTENTSAASLYKCHCTWQLPQRLDSSEGPELIKLLISQPARSCPLIKLFISEKVNQWNFYISLAFSFALGFAWIMWKWQIVWSKDE